MKSVDKIQRNSNIELLRVVSMSFIVMGHFISQTNSFENHKGVYRFFTYLFGSGARIAVNIFLIIGVWFLVDSKFSAKRIMKLYAQLWFYVFPLSIISFFIKPEIGFDFKALLPLLSSRLWFVSSYMVLLVLAPFMQPIFRSDYEYQKRLVIIMTIIIPLMSLVHIGSDSYLDALIWFIYVYIVVGFIKYNGRHLKLYLKRVYFPKIYFILTISIYMILVFIRMYYKDVTVGLGRFLYGIAFGILTDYKTFFNFAIALFVFLFVVSRKARYDKVVNRVAKSTLSVYIIHQVPAFYPILWSDVFLADIWTASNYLFIGLFGIVIVLYLLAIMLDCLFEILFRKLLKGSAVLAIVEKINVFYERLFETRN